MTDKGNLDLMAESGETVNTAFSYNFKDELKINIGKPTLTEEDDDLERSIGNTSIDIPKDKK
jgi:hypothetical protein